MTPAEAHRLSLALEALRGTMESGFTAVRGDINLLAHKESRNSSDLRELDDRVDALEERRFPLPTIGGIMGVAGVVISLASVLKGG